MIGEPATVAQPGAGQHFARFCFRYVVHTKGRWAGEPFVLEPWEREFVDELFRVENGRRLYTEALLMLPRKQGKSTLAAALALYLLAADGEQGPEVYCAAAARDQARIVFDQCSAMVEASPGLQDFVRVRQYHLACKSNGGVLRVISSDAKLQHGLSPSGAIIDELHAHEDGDLYTALTTGSGAREQPLIVSITTAGYDPESVLGKLYERAMALPELERRTPYLSVVRNVENGFLFWCYGAPQDADFRDPAVWAGCNPASWITEEYLRRQLEKPSMNEADFRRLHLNAWVSAEQSWLPSGTWEACRGPVVFDPDLPLGVGIDMAQTFDTAAVVMAQKQDERVAIRARVWANPYDAKDPRARSWSVPTEEVRTFLRDLFRDYRVPASAIDDIPQDGPAFAYDPWHFRESAEMLTQEGLAMVEFPQFNSYMVPASQGLYELAVSHRLVHDGDPVLARQVANTVSILTPRGWRISKPRKGGSRKNDAAVAAAMAVYQVQHGAPQERRFVSSYEVDDLLVV